MNTSCPKIPQALRAALLRSSSRFRLAGSVLVSMALAMMSWSSAAVAQCQPEWLSREWFSVGTIGAGYLHDVEVVSNGDLVVCGDYLLGSGQSSRIARWDGVQWSPLGPGLPAAAWCMTELPDGRLAVGLSNAVMVWDGAVWTQLGGTFDGAVKTMTIRNGELVAAGGFTLAGGNPANRIARWDGTGWVALGTGLANGLVNEITTLTNGDLVAAGSFTSPGRFVARWNGTTWAAMGTGPSSALTPQARTVAQDPVSGSIYLGGDAVTMISMGGFVDRWNGSAWVSMLANVGANSSIRRLKFLPGGELLIAGELYHGPFPRGTARWNGTSWQFPSAAIAPEEPTNVEDAVVLGNGTLVAMQSYDLRRYGCPDSVAVATEFGAGCHPQSQAFYEEFSSGNFMDLSDSTLYLAPAGPGYSVQHVFGTPQFHTPVSPDLALGDDELSGPIALPFSLPVQGSSPVNAIQVGSNGFVNLSADTSASPYWSVQPFLVGPHRHSPLWCDLDPSTATGSGTIHVDVDSVAQVVYVTWLNVQQYGFPFDTSTFQLALGANGTIEYRYQTCSMPNAMVLVGWSPGQSDDPGSRDLSAGPFTTASFDLEHHAQSNPAVGTALILETANVPPTSLFGCSVVGWGQHNPGIDLSSLGMPGCHQYTSADVAVLFLPIGGSGYHALSIPPMAALIGAHAYSQGLAFVPGVNPLGAITSNGVNLRFGTL